MEQIEAFLKYKLFEFDNYSVAVYQILAVFAIYFAIKVLLWLLSNYFKRRFLNKLHIDTNRQASLVQLVKYFLYVLACFLLLEVFHINITLVIAGSTALLVGVGIGLQEMFHNLISGVIILFEGNINIGNVIQVDGTVGKVKQVGLRTTHIVTRLGKTIIIPNSKFSSNNVINWDNFDKHSGFVVEVGVAYGSDLELVRKLLIEATTSVDRIVKIPGAKVRMVEFGGSSLDFHLIFWTIDVWGVEDIKSDLRIEINRLFTENNISIPFPQQDIYVKELPTKD